ncbi:multidrug efflux SMR transporter [Nocardioides sp.]|uniref:DMT family transporter n=1 Tax=Nocardioides sp. TaxID=35761 RepID=UPI003563AE16
MVLAWVLLGVAIGVEVLATASLPRADGFREPAWTAAILAGYGISIWLLTLVVREIQVSVAYAVWSGAGTAAIAVIGVAYLGERVDALKIIAVVFIIAGVLILNLRGGH